MRMKNSVRALAFLALAMGTAAEAAVEIPRKVGFQGKLLDTSNNPRNGSFNFTFRIFSAPTGGSALWTEVQNGVAVNNGVFNVQLGGVAPLATELFMGASSYLEVEVAPDAPMTPRQLLLMSPYAFRSLLAEDLSPGNTKYVQVADALQAGAMFHVSSGTVEGPFLATGTSSFTAVGSQAFSLLTSSGVRIAAGTLRVEGSGGIDVVNMVQAATVSARSGLLLPQGAASTLEGSARWDAAQNLLSVGDGAGSRTLADTNSVQTLTNKTLSSTGGNTVDATMLRSRLLAAVAPSDGMTLKWSAGAAQWEPVYPATVTVVTHSFTPAANRGMTANVVYLIPVTVPGVLRLNQIRYRVTGAVGGVSGDAGLYDTSGALVAGGGASSADFTTTGAKVVAMAGAPVTIQPGQYFLAVTCNGAPTVRGNNLVAAGVVKGLGTAAEAGGTSLPSSVSLSAVADGVEAFFLSMNE